MKPKTLGLLRFLRRFWLRRARAVEELQHSRAFGFIPFTIFAVIAAFQPLAASASPP